MKGTYVVLYLLTRWKLLVKSLFRQLDLRPILCSGCNVSWYICLSIYLSVLPMWFFLGLSLALRSHDQIPASHWSTPPPLPPPPDWGSNVIPPDFIRLFIRFEGEGGGFPPNFITDSSLALYKICGQDVMTNALLFYPSLNKSYIRHNNVVFSSCVWS